MLQYAGMDTINHSHLPSCLLSIHYNCVCFLLQPVFELSLLQLPTKCKADWPRNRVPNFTMHLCNMVSA